MKRDENNNLPTKNSQKATAKAPLINLFPQLPSQPHKNPPLPFPSTHPVTYVFSIPKPFLAFIITYTATASIHPMQLFFFSFQMEEL